MTKSSLIWKKCSQKTAVQSCRLWRLNLNFHDIPPSSVGVRFCSPMLISDLDFGILPRLLLSIRSFRAKADFLVVSILEIGAECPNHPWMDSSPLYRKSSLLLNLESEVKLFAWKQGGSPDRPWVLHFFYICNRHFFIYAIVTAVILGITSQICHLFFFSSQFFPFSWNIWISIEL